MTTAGAACTITGHLQYNLWCADRAVPTNADDDNRLTAWGLAGRQISLVGPVIADPAPHWQADATDFVKAFTAFGGQVGKAKLAGTSLGRHPRTVGRRVRSDVVVFAGETGSGAAEVCRAMREAGSTSDPLRQLGRFFDGSGAHAQADLHRAGEAAAGTNIALASFAPPRADFVDADRSAFGEEPTDYAAAAMRAHR